MSGILEVKGMPMNYKRYAPWIATLGLFLTFVAFSCGSEDDPTGKVPEAPKTYDDWRQEKLDKRKAVAIEKCELILQGTPIMGKHILGCKLPNGKNKALMSF